ncbi:MAG: hypothetical protein ABSB40_10995 [Nitrososphaeria archaeon]
MGHEPHDDFVYCIKCPENKRTGDERSRCRKEEIEEDQWGKWTCSRCRSETIGLQLIDFIKTRISVTATEDEDRSRFIFRELLQNADDVKSVILVLRFEEDALYVANDGRSFTTTIVNNQLSDFDRISRILGRHQAEDKETVGHFSSGFQTTYAITNSPEVHSSGISGQMNPTRNTWNYEIEERTSPYVHKERKGVLFRFPWRDDNRAEEEIGGIRAFEDSNYWPRWNEKERRGLYEDLKGYIAQAILCCQYLETIRLIWHDGSHYEGFQVTRDFKTRIDDSVRLSFGYGWFLGIVTQGLIEPKTWKDEWNESFQSDAWSWCKGMRTLQYLVGYATVSDSSGKPLYFGKRPDGSCVVTSNRQALVKELKRGDIHLLFPLFDITTLDSKSDGRAYLYSVIPLPKKGQNMFVFTGHFFPTEDRKDVDVEGYGGVNREWYQTVMLNVLYLYQYLFPFFLKEIQSLQAPSDDCQRIILNSIPATVLPEWMRPGREAKSGWWEKEQNQLINFIIDQPIFFTNGSWISPINAYWAQSDDENDVLKTMNMRTFTSSFIEHPHFKASLASKLEYRKLIIAEDFLRLWDEFESKNHDNSGQLIYQQSLTGGGILDKGAANSLIRYCITRENAWDKTTNLPIIPGKDSFLRPIREYPLLPEQLDFMLEIVPKSRLIHPDFKLSELKERVKQQRASTYLDVVNLIDEIVNENPSRFSNMDSKDHALISKVLVTLVEKMGFTLSENMINLKFIPYKQGNSTSIGTPNTRIVNGHKELIKGGAHIGENYMRDSIFGVQRIQVPGITQELETKIKFLSILGYEEVSEIENALFIVKLMENPNEPTNFIRHFLSPRHGSLFKDSILCEYIGTDNVEVIQKNKKVFLDALKSYFDSPKKEQYLTPKDMSGVPCLYDEEGKWYGAGEFALEIYPELELIGYKSRHKDFQKWPKETLLALGAVESPSCAKIIEVIRKLSLEKEKNRRVLADIVIWLLTSDVAIDSGLKEIETLAWIPSTDKGYRCANDILIPYPKNKDIMGKDYDGFLDDSPCSTIIRTNASIRLKEKPISDERIKSLSLKSSPKLSDMLNLVKELRLSNSEPPPDLFNALNEMIVSSKESNPRMDDYGYYFENKWISSKRIRLMDEKAVPKEIKGAFTILDSKHEHHDYLLFDGAKNSLSLDDLLSSLLKPEIVPSLNLWDEIRKYESQLQWKHKEIYGQHLIYPLNNCFANPENIICLENDPKNSFLNEGVYGKYFVISQNLTERHGTTLKKLGARSDSELTEEDIIDLIRLEKQGWDSMDSEKVQTILHLITRIIELNPKFPFPNQPLWPARMAGDYIWLEPKSCYVMDSSIGKYFSDLAFICLELDGKENGYLRDYAILNGCKRFSEFLKKTSHRDFGFSEPNKGLTSILNELATVLSMHFKTLTGASECFSWLRNIEVYNCDELDVHYAIPMLGKTSNIVTHAIPKYALIEKTDTKWLILVNFGNIKAYDELVDAIVEECIERGFPKGSEIDELTFLIYKLLKNPPISWGDLVEGYEFPEENVVGLYQPSILGVEGGKGYLETRQKLQEWYHSCQICGNQTPGDESGIDTMETVKSVVSMRGGRYRSVRAGYSPDNCLLLCPMHQILYERGLIRFPDFEAIEDIDILQRIEQKIEEYDKIKTENRQQKLSWNCEVFEGKFDWFGQQRISGENVNKIRWNQEKIAFTMEHLTSFLKNMLSYFKEAKKVRSGE